MVGPLNLGLGQFSYHRYYGDLTHGETDPGASWGLADFLDKAKSHRVGVVGLQTCYLTPSEIEHFPEITAKWGQQIMLEWGHPDGLRMGKSPASIQDLLSWIARAGRWSIPLLRIVAGYPNFRGQELVEVQTRRLIPILKELCSVAKDYGITLAIENHADFTPAELKKLIEATDEPNLEAVLDFGNSVRVGEDLIQSVRSLASMASVIHLRDLLILPESIGDPTAPWPAAPLGCGSLPIGNALQELYAGGFSGYLLLELSHLHANWEGREDDVIRQSLLWLKEWETSKGL
jgi:sugar phosphate isomerase/epimerase